VSGSWKAQNARFKETAAMKKIGIALVLLTIFLTTCTGIYAQKPELKTPDVTKLTVDKILQLQAATVPQSNGDLTPLQVVAEFLQLQPAQITELGQFLQTRQATLAPLVQTLQALTQRLGILLNSGGSPAQVGAVVIQIHAVQQQVVQAQQTFLTQFTAILDAEQLQKLQAVQIAAQLQPILPAFEPIFLF
jgi:hypothetical protein